MSILSSLYHGEIHDKPNDVHNVPETGHSGGRFGGNGNGGSGGSSSRNAYGGAGTGSGSARQAVHAGSWMGVSFADESTMDAQLADAHAVALSDAFDRADLAPRRTQGRTGSGAPSHTQKSADDSAAHSRTQKSTDGSAVLPRHAERRMEALKEGDLRPPLYYTGQEQTPCANGVWESAHTVASKLESKEEFPQG